MKKREKEKEELDLEEEEKETLLDYMKIQNETLKRIFKNTIGKEKDE